MSLVEYNRTKSRGSPTWETTPNELWYKDMDDVHTKSSEWSAKSSYFYEVMYGVNTPDYHKRLKRGELLPLTPFAHYMDSCEVTVSEFDVRTYRDSDGKYTSSYYVNDGTAGFHGVHNKAMVAASALPDLSSLDEMDRLVQAAAASLYGSGFDALTFVAEAHKVVAMFRGFLKRLISLATAGKLERLWLEGRYGWRILVFDMIEISEYLSNLDKEGKDRHRRTQGTKVSYSEVSVDPISGSTYTANVRSTHNYEVMHRGTVVADISPPDITLNPIKTAWELITFSFVIDWVIGVGKWIDALSFLAVQQAHFAAGGYFIKHVGSSSIVDLDWTTAPAGYTYGGSIRCEAKSESYYKRRVPSSVSLLPQFNVNLDAYKVADLIALLIQALRRK